MICILFSQREHWHSINLSTITCSYLRRGTSHSYQIETSVLQCSSRVSLVAHTVELWVCLSTHTSLIYSGESLILIRSVYHLAVSQRSIGQKDSLSRDLSVLIKPSAVEHKRFKQKAQACLRGYLYKSVLRRHGKLKLIMLVQISGPLKDMISLMNQRTTITPFCQGSRKNLWPSEAG